MSILPTDEIRGSVSLSPMFYGETRQGLNGWCCHTSQRGLLFCLSSVVVNRSPLHAGKERNALSAGQGASASLKSEDLLSSATSRLEARPSQPTASPGRGVGGKKKDEACSENGRSVAMTNLRERPLRLEVSLTQDYINRAVKMAEIEARMNQKALHPMAVVFAWVVAGVVVTWALLNL